MRSGLANLPSSLKIGSHLTSLTPSHFALHPPLPGTNPKFSQFSVSHKSRHLNLLPREKHKEAKPKFFPFCLSRGERHLNLLERRKFRLNFGENPRFYSFCYSFEESRLKFSKREKSRAISVMATAYKPEEARRPPALPFLPAAVSKFKIALCQLSVTADKVRNIAHARKAIEEAAGKGAKLVVLPEIWNSPYSNESFPVYAEDIDAGGDASPSTLMLSEAAYRLGITIVGGSIPERCGDQLYNTSCVFGADGKLKAKHRKIHLFDIDIPGKITFQESKTLAAGTTPTIVDTDVGRIGIGICYDIRFQELAMIYAARGAHLLCYPGAFNMTTGPLHWELLQRARAVDNQIYVATCSPARDAGAGYTAWGHSTLVSPYGELIATTEHEEAIVVGEIDYSLIDQIRMGLPLQKQRRGDLYQLVDVERLSSEEKGH
ncbi:omega-amidase, chloroplastic isoform X1 [Amborella trichopoda]|nr:omega-amidase, chloroplastic isoform X1 [Amborella trichopoda]XP_020526078.1 omega-amidase, chloroplastic isoform X1 [Amborella trichopoda]|eukprot:XP_006849615.2 omega-amidase, chloroplastic isoform X1 [Amborella trichopoda]